MSETIEACERLLGSFGYDAQTSTATGRPVVLFESDTVIGFVLAFPDARKLADEWRTEVELLLAHHQFQLRRSREKAWNVYVVLLAYAEPTFEDRTALGAIEEDLVAARKIARAGVRTDVQIEKALIPLLPIRSAPALEPISLPDEIRLRTAGLEARAVEAFLSEASEGVVVQILEEIA